MNEDMIKYGVIITKQITTEEALDSNKVSMVGRMLGKREFDLLRTNAGYATTIDNVETVKDINKSVSTTIEVNTNTVTDVNAAEIEDKVEIPAFLLEMQAERKAAKRMKIAYMTKQTKKVQKKKAHTTKPFFRTAFSSILDLL